MGNTGKMKSTDKVRNNGTGHKNIFRHLKDVTAKDLGYKSLFIRTTKTMGLIKFATIALSLLLIYPILASTAASIPPSPSVSADVSSFSLQNGQTKQITFNVQNNGGNSTTNSYLSISVSSGLDIIGYSSSSSSMKFAIYPPGSSIWTSSGTVISSTYTLLDVTKAYPTGSSATVTITVKAKTPGSQWIKYRMSFSDGSRYYRNPTSGDTDQQGRYVYTINGNVSTATPTPTPASTPTPTPASTPTPTPTPASTPTPTPTPSPTPTPTLNSTIPQGYTLIFSDEFNYPVSIDPISTNSTFASKWFYDTSICDSSAGAWPGNNVQTDGNSNLVIKVSGSSNGGGIISSCDMKGNIREAFLYGYFEFRVKAPHTNQVSGVGWDIWLSGANTWPPEIDLTESGSGPVNKYGGINQIMSTLHWAPDNQNEQNEYIYYDTHGNITTTPTSNPVDLSNDYHTYGLLWTPSYVSISLDGVQIAKWTANIPQDYLYIVMSASNPGTVGLNPPASSNIYPSYMYVDYVRVYQKSN